MTHHCHNYRSAWLTLGGRINRTNRSRKGWELRKSTEPNICIGFLVTIHLTPCKQVVDARPMRFGENYRTVGADNFGSAFWVRTMRPRKLWRATWLIRVCGDARNSGHVPPVGLACSWSGTLSTLNPWNPVPC